MILWTFIKIESHSFQYYVVDISSIFFRQLKRKIIINQEFLEISLNVGFMISTICLLNNGQLLQFRWSYWIVEKNDDESPYLAHWSSNLMNQVTIKNISFFSYYITSVLFITLISEVEHLLASGNLLCTKKFGIFDLLSLKFHPLNQHDASY